MVELIVGKKGKGKTKVLLDKVNGAIKDADTLTIRQTGFLNPLSAFLFFCLYF